MSYYVMSKADIISKVVMIPLARFNEVTLNYAQKIDKFMNSNDVKYCLAHCVIECVKKPF